MRKNFTNTQEYEYRGYYIYKITRRDYCVFNENGMFIDATSLKDAKVEIDNLLK